MDSNSKDFALGIPFYRFYYDESKVDSILQNLKDLEYRNNDTNWIWTGVKEDGVSGSDLYKLPQFKELFEWMHKCLDEVAKDMRLTSKLIINSAWANLNTPGDYFYNHTHSLNKSLLILILTLYIFLHLIYVLSIS